MDHVTTRCWIVRGRVQGVNFRAFVRSHALRLGVTGYARNLPDGSVRVLATGAPAVHAKLLRQIRRGPRRARVDEVSEVMLTDAYIEEEHAGFFIR